LLARRVQIAEYARHSALLGSEAGCRQINCSPAVVPGSVCPLASGGAGGSVAGRSSRKRLSYWSGRPPCGRLDSDSSQRPARLGMGCPCDARSRSSVRQARVLSAWPLPTCEPWARLA